MRFSSTTSRHPLLVATSFVLAPALWIALVGTNAHEMLIGAVASIGAVWFTFFICRSSPLDLTLRAADVLQCWWVPWYVLSGVYRITLVLFKDLAGIQPAQNLFRVCGFDTTEHDPLWAARTILAVAYTTAAPNFIVIGVDPAQSRMLFHQISPTEIPRMTRALGARA